MKQAKRTALAGLLLSLVMPSPAGASMSYDRAQAERYIAGSEREWSSTNPHELAVVKRIIADGFVWLLDGKVLGKSDAIADAKRSKRTTTQRFDYVHIRFFGNIAIAQGQSTVTAQNGAKIRNLFMDTWVLRSGQWQIVAATDVDSKE
jgi:hypothetical protein